MNRILFFLIFSLVFSCKMEERFFPGNISKAKTKRDISEVVIDTVFPWKNVMSSLNYSIRAIELTKENVWYAASNGGYEKISNDNKSLKYWRLMKNDTTGYEIRSVAKTKDAFFGLTISNPAILFKQDSIGRHVVYKEEHDKVFYDAMDFWNDQEGIAIGDPTENCMSIIITRDGGNTWTKLSCDNLPNTIEGEAAFAASDTNIAILGDNTWVATGGKASRVLYSPDKGKTWKVFDTPIIQGESTTGMYSIDFYDELNGYAIGGDYTKPEDNKANKIRTTDGGKTWELVAQNQEPGYRSCVQYIPNGKGNELVAVGFKGMDYSNDYGTTWKHLSDEGFYTIRFLNDSIAYAGGKGRISKLTFRE
ncbi:MAG: oxidoreductase [Flavobacteriaceae bacterium]|nr:oxidoreductase [Bacteroidia bacterium]NNL16937.1 oxidoreductase [Flavobacteriaceae bacterium]